MKNLTKIALISVALLSALNVNTYAACSADLNMGNNKISSLGTPSADADAATKLYVDTEVSAGTTKSEVSDKLILSEESAVSSYDMGGALRYCRNLPGGTTDRPWRLPNLDEMTIAISNSVNIEVAVTGYAQLWLREYSVSEDKWLLIIPNTGKISSTSFDSPDLVNDPYTRCVR